MSRIIFEDHETEAWHGGCHIGGESCAAVVRLVTERVVEIPASNYILPRDQGQVYSDYRRKWGEHRRLFVVEFDVVDHVGMIITCGLCTLDSDRLELIGAVTAAPHPLSKVFSPAGQSASFADAEAAERLIGYLLKNRNRFFGRCL